MEKEIWKDIIDYEGLYQVSNLGRVRRLRKLVKGKLNSERFLKEKILKQSFCGRYLKVNLSKNNKMKNFYIHRLVAMAFINNDISNRKTVVDHKNNIPTDNRLENIQIISQRENASKDRKNGTSIYTGVFWDSSKNKWRAKIQINGKYKYLGHFLEEKDAHFAYQKELNKL